MGSRAQEAEGATGHSERRQAVRENTGGGGGTAGDFLGEKPPCVVERQAGQAVKGLTSKVGGHPVFPGTVYTCCAWC